MQEPIEHHANVIQDINIFEVNKYQTIKKFVDAIKWNGENDEITQKFFGEDHIQFSQDKTIIFLKTNKEADVEIKINDFLIKDNDGNIYGRNETEFADEYEPVGKKVTKPTVSRHYGNSFNIDISGYDDLKLDGKITCNCMKCQTEMVQDLSELENVKLIIGDNNLTMVCTECETIHNLKSNLVSVKGTMKWDADDLVVVEAE